MIFVKNRLIFPSKGIFSRGTCTRFLFIFILLIFNYLMCMPPPFDVPWRARRYNDIIKKYKHYIKGCNRFDTTRYYTYKATCWRTASEALRTEWSSAARVGYKVTCLRARIMQKKKKSYRALHSRTAAIDRREKISARWCGGELREKRTRGKNTKTYLFT